MRVFVSWSGARSEGLGLALKDWLPKVLPAVETFHSADIPKGENWHSALIKELRGCRVGVFCVTPESLQSPWMLFEAGALAQHGNQPELFTYLYGIARIRVSGPLGHFQATRFDREDSRRFVRDLARLVDGGGAHPASDFDDRWNELEANVLPRMLLPIQRLIPEFPELFANEMTFHEPFPDCSNKRWDDRLRRTARVHETLSRPDIADIVASDPYLSSAFEELLIALDRYDMHIGAFLMEPLEYTDLDENKQRQLEDARTRVLNLVTALERQREPPVFRESLTFEAEPSTETRKELIHKLELRLAKIPSDRLLAARDSLEWSLDRIAFYAAFGAGLLPNVPLSDLVSALKREEEQARARNLVKGLQSVYYAAEAIDERLTPPVYPDVAERLSEVLESLDRFLQADARRDDGEHIRRRMTSIRRKALGSQL
jgi:hypothetical protein